MDKITTINKRIEQLKKQRAKIQIQQAILFLREAEKLFAKDFSPPVALAMLSDWNTAPEAKKKEWINKSNSFRHAFFPNSHQKAETHIPTPHQNGKEETAENE